MKKFIHAISILFLFCSALPVIAQNAVDAGINQTIYCSGSVQLNATPMNGWAYLNTFNTMAMYSIYFTSAANGFAVGNMGTIMITHDGGNTWTAGPVEGTNTLNSVYFINPTTGFIAGNSGLLVKTTDGGNTWTPQTSGTTVALRSIFFTSATTGYVVGSGGIILKTTNGGTTWSQVSSGTSSVLQSVYFPTPDTGYITGTSGMILKTTDAGSTWATQTSGSTGTLYSVYFPTATTGFIAGSAGTILKTTDGNTWSKYVADSIYTGTDNGIVSKTNGRLLKTAILQAACFTSATTGYIAGGYGTGSIFLKTIDGGATWFEEPFNGTGKVTSLCFPTANTGFASGVKIARLTTGALQPCTYQWYPTDGLSNPYIANPVASPTVSTNYIVYATDSIGTFSDTIQVSVSALTVNMSANKTIGCEGSVLLDSVRTNYTGSGKLRYKWTPSTGLSCDTIASPMATVTVPTFYKVHVTTPSGCSSEGSVMVSVSPLTVTVKADTFIVCSGSAQLSATTNYSGKSALHYKWTPSTGLSNDTIANPVATVSSLSIYSVQVTSGSGCTATGSVTVKVSNLTANAGADKTVNCGQTVPLDGVTTNYNGTGVLRYKWTPSAGLSNDTIANPIVTGGSITSYNVTVTAPSGCTASDNVIIHVNPITLNVGADQTATCGAQVQLGVSSTNYTGTGLKYKWTPSTGLSNDTIPNPIASAGNNTYTLTITTPSGCTASDNVAISIIPMNKPVINYVGVNANNKNILVWTAPSTSGISSYNVYKETNVSNSYAKVGIVSVDSATVYVDKDSNPDVQSNKYKISLVDACGNETALSDYHKSMHLSINKGINTIWNLIWEAYEGFSVSTYNIYRGTTPANIQIIGSLSGSNTQFSDYTAPTGYVYYQIEAVNSGASGVQQYKSGVKASVETTYSSRSNVATNKSGMDGLFNLQDISNVISIHPNPASNSIQLVIGDIDIKNMKLRIYNTLGSLVLTNEILQNEQDINISKLNTGIYLLQVQNDKYSGIQKLIIQK